MATLPEFRGKGVGTKLLHSCLDHARDQNGSEVWCNARTTASGFYFNAGFVNLTPDPYDLPGLGPHYQMTFPIGVIQNINPL